MGKFDDELEKELAKLEKQKKKKKTTDLAKGRLSYLPSSDEDDIGPVGSVSGGSFSSKNNESEDDLFGLDLFQKGAFDDGYQFGDVTKTLLGTVGDIGLGAIKGAANTVGGIVDLAQYGVAGVADLLGADDFAKQQRQWANKDIVNSATKSAEEFLDDYSILGRTSSAITEGLGQVGTMILTGGLGKAAGLGNAGVTALTSGSMFASGMGSGMSEAYGEGATDEEAVAYGAISGAADALSEMLFGGLGKGLNATGFNKGLLSADDLLAKKVSGLFKSHLAKNFAEYGIKAGAEGFEEVIAGIAQAGGKKLTYMSEEDFSKLLEDENLLEQFVVGSIVSGIAQAKDVRVANKTETDFVTGMTKNEQAVVKKETENRIAEREADGTKLTRKEKAAIEAQVEKDLAKGYISTDTIEEVLGGETYKSYKDTIDSEDALFSEADSLQEEFDKLNKIDRTEMTPEQVKREAELESLLSETRTKVEDTRANSQRNQLKERLGSEVMTIAQGDRLIESYNERTRRTQAFEADLSKYDEKQQAVIQKAAESGILNNTNRTHEFVDMVAKISADKGVLFDFTNNARLKESGFAVDGKVVNGYVTKDGITLNVQSAKSLNSLVGHEITHVLEGTDLYKELQGAVLEYAMSKNDYTDRYNALAEMYKNIKGANVYEELTADLVGDYLFTDQDFINNLSTNHRNVFQKIYDEVKYLLKVVTAGSKEARQLEKVKRAFEKAYKADTNTKTEVKTEGETMIDPENDSDLDYESPMKYSVSVTDPETIAFLENQEHITTYKAMVLIDGKLYPPMASKVKGEDGKYRMTNPRELGEWQQATEDTTNIKFNDKGIGYYDLKKDDGGTVRAAYNPYEHSSNLVLNDQFEAAYKRDNLVTVECEIPVSEMSSGYRAEHAKDSVGMMDWHSGVVAGKLKDNKRMVYLSRYLKAVRILSDAETAVKFKEIVGDTPVPFNVVSPGLLAELEKIGVTIDYNGSPQYQYLQRKAAEREAKKAGKAKYSLSDSAGRQLSQEQQEYFKDSAIKDKNGNLLVLYHGTNSEFTAFDKNKIEEGSFGTGFYFTTNISEAEEYGGRVLDVYLNIKNPFELGEGRDTHRLKEYLDKNGIKYDYNGGYFYENPFDCMDSTDCMKAITALGYDGIKPWDDMFIAFEPNQIKSVDNTTPTNEPDIRYSLSEDSDGNRLTKEQEEYFKNSKVRDAKGNLKPMYHGSGDGGFHVFDSDYSDDSTSLFFVDSNVIAKGYSGTSETYVAKSLRSAKDLNDLFNEIESTEYTAAEEDGEYILYEDGDEVARSETADGLYEEFRDWTGLGYGSVNYKVYLNLTNPLEVDAQNNNWDELPGIDGHNEVYDYIKVVSVGDKAGEVTVEYAMQNDTAPVTETVDLYERFDDGLADRLSDLAPGESIKNVPTKSMTTREYAAYAKEHGYDGVIFTNIVDTGVYASRREVMPATVAVAFDSNQVKSVANTQPTGDPDIRYSLSDDSWTQIHEMQMEVNKLDESIREFEASEDYKDQMRKITEAIGSGNADEAVESWNQWYKESGLEVLTDKRKSLRDELDKLRKSAEEARANEALEEERFAIEKSGLSEADYFRKKAVKEFGYTPYFYDAGYIVSNGRMLNFSGEKGQHFGSRGQDHRAIGTIYAETAGTDALNRFVNDGNIRIVPESPGFDVSATIEPTKEQYATIKKFVYAYADKGYFSVDISDKDGRVVGSFDYENNINPARIIADLKHYYATGEVRQHSALEGFRYSLSEDSQGRELSPATAKRFSNSKAVDEDGNLQVVYHGTAAGEFTIFDKSKGSVEGDFGSGFYFTNDDYDVEENYEGGGPDFDNKVARLAEQIEQEEEIDYEEAEERARAELYKGGHKFEVYLNIENPAIVGETMLFDNESYLEQYNEEDYDDYDEYIADVEQLLADDIENIVWEVEKNVDIDSADGLADILYEAYYEGGIGIEDLKKKVNELYLEDSEGNLAGNEVTRQIIESLGYDGIIDNTVSSKFNMGLEESTTHYIVFKPNQIKAVTNENPTDNPDIHRSLSSNGKRQRTFGKYNVYGRDVALPSALEEIGPTAQENRVVETVSERDILGTPATEEEVSAYGMEMLDHTSDTDAPPEMDAPYFEDSQAEVEDPFEDRDWFEVSKDRKTPAYMYENPEVKPFFQDEAQKMLDEYNNTIRGERWFNDEAYYNSNGESGFGGVSRFTSKSMETLLDDWKMRYDDIEKGLKAIIEDNGAENIAAAKKIEFMLNDRLLNGYEDFWTGQQMPPSQEYIQMLEEKQITEYHQEAFDRLMANPDQFAPFEEAPETEVTEVTEETTATEDIAPLYDAIPKKGVLEGQQSMVQEEEAPKELTRKELHKNIIDRMKAKFAGKGYDLDTVLDKAKNLSTFATVDNTPQRVMEKALGYKEGGILADITVNQVAQNESAGIKWLNSFTNRKNGLLAQISRQYRIKPGSKESAAAQMYAEGFYVNEVNDIVKYGDAELFKDFRDPAVRSRIKGLANDPRIRQIYDETLNAINESRTRNAYPEIPRLDNYFLHFRAMNDTFSRLGLPFNPNDIRAKDLPTDLNGVTADLKPGQPYFASAQHRRGIRTSFDLLGGLEQYLTSAKNQIYHIDDIQNLRALRNYIADMYGQANGLEGLDILTEEEAQDRIEQVYGAHLSTFAKFLNEEANVLAGKTALIDRGLEGIIGRRGMTFLNEVNKQVGSNMVGYNISSSLTNFLAPVQALAKTNKASFVKGMAQFTSNKVASVFGKGDGFAEQSPVMIRRQGADRFHRTFWQKMSDPGYMLMSAVDNVSTELIARAKYNEFIKKGMDSQQAHIETDKWTSRLMGDRSLGQMPQIYNSKMLGLITKFQLEVRNQLDSQFYDTIQEAKVSSEHIQNGLLRNAKKAAKITSALVQLAIGQHIFGKAFESVAGYNPAFDIISTIMTAFGWDDEEESEDTVLDNIEQAFLDLLEDLPYTSTLTGGRIPISSALPVAELIKGEDQYGNEKSRLEILSEVAPYYLMPGGYGQLKKTKAGLEMFSDEHPIAGSYTDSGKLRFPVEDNVKNRAQAAIFGQYASENARDYFDNDRSALTEKQTQELGDTGMDIHEYWDYREGLKGLEKLEDKVDYVYGLNLTIDQKNILVNNLTDRKEKIDLTHYGKYSSLEEFDYATDNPEKYAFLENEGIGYYGYKALDQDTKDSWSWAFNHQDEYRYYKENGVMPEDYGVYRVPMLDFDNEEDTAYQWAFENPEKATFGKVFSDGVVGYRQYAKDLSELKADKDENGNSISGSKKEKVLDYINNLDIDYGQKMILYRTMYSSKSDRAEYNEQIVEYLNGRKDISYEEMVTILEELDMTVKDGRVYWD